jgi:glutaminase
MGNPGAMPTASMAPGGNTGEKWRFLQEGLSRFAGRELSIDEETFASASAANAINRAIGDLLRSYGRQGAGSEETVDLVHQEKLR